MKKKLLTLLCSTLIFTTTPVTAYAADFYDTVESLTNSNYKQIGNTFLEYLTGNGQSTSCGFNAEDKITDFVLVFEAADPTLLRLSATFDYMWGDRMVVEESDWDFDVSTGKYVAKAHFSKLGCVEPHCAIGSDDPVDLYITPYVKYKDKPNTSVNKNNVTAKHLYDGSPIPSVLPKIDGGTNIIACTHDSMSTRSAVIFKAPVSGEYTIFFKDLKFIEEPVEVFVSKLVNNERQSIKDVMHYGFRYDDYSSHWLCYPGYDASGDGADKEIEQTYQLDVTLKKGDIYLIETDTGSNNAFQKYGYTISVDGPAFLSKKSATVKAGKTLNLTLHNTSAVVKWYTSNKKVATVNGGKVKGKKKGTCVITAKCNDKTYKCKIKVK